ncbi:Holliday junction branch migration protein RuvA [Borrelia hermsii]|uniref:Holliday junction branch migration complex subunit RuvA n=3 Tax=Borrelia hermsii TaxID=140 RepID=RUVA_BORHD|nr:Holliday junction branch migration protein RuvA [Borrelia hermsii]B2S1L2.1 RecName: Full=Holliday junction branch migration complex subunit RuvA [Borrelia hermsii DAH]AAX16549.1 Holliday junction DNA helicase RuvA [Borrelia hermsii DAH]AJW72860.1 ATP-dependent DNA helicase RuvA [Borrelia hermsii CC1]AMR75784.1 Holliday junction ATP-dependent DNA helicase ruvA [Borrelia hermsii]ANA42848.1 ATP-dependent DNA helicase RuvA [Borrelia hermsii HS1]UPA07388.1 Holliday junction branch migration pro
MINKIYGKIIEKRESSIVIVALPFEFEVLVSSFCNAELRLLEDVEILTYLHLREDEIKLFGFLNVSEREVFEELISVDGIGPRAALRMLSGMKYDEFRDAIEREDVKRISTVKGIGNKVAGKIFLKLRGKLVKADELTSSVFKFKDLEQSIVNMGFDRKLVVAAIKEIMLIDEFLMLREVEQEQFLFRETLKRLSG